MTDLAILGNRPSNEWIAPWSYLESGIDAIGAASPVGSMASSSPIHPAFTIQKHWERGGHPASLFASSQKKANAALDQLVATGMPPLPAVTDNGAPIDPMGVWRTMAIYNGCPLNTLRRKLYWDLDTFSYVIELLCERDLIFTIGYRPITGKKFSDLYYFRDTGILHRLLGENSELTGKGRGKFDNSWEGFAIQMICRGIATEADASVWRKDNTEEIDLLLNWPDNSRWGVEIGRGQNKRPSKGFWLAANELQLTNEFIIHNGECDSIGSCRRFTLEAFMQASRNGTLV